MNRVVWVDLPVADLERAVNFYSALLGEPVERQAGGGYVVGLLLRSQGGVGARLVRDPAGAQAPSAGAGPTANAPSRTGALVYLAVPSGLREALRVTRAVGGEVLAEPHSLGGFGWRALILDSEGNRIALHAATGD